MPRTRVRPGQSRLEPNPSRTGTAFPPLSCKKQAAVFSEYYLSASRSVLTHGGLHHVCVDYTGMRYKASVKIH